MKNTFLLLIFSLTLAIGIATFSTCPVMADETQVDIEHSTDTSDNKVIAAEAEDTSKTEEDIDPVPELKLRLRQTAEDVFTNLTTAQMKKAYKLRATHGVIMSVESVRNDLSRAVESCHKNNGKMESLESSFRAWEKDINDYVVLARTYLEEQIVAADYLPKSSFRKYLSLVDRLADIHEERIVKDYLSSEESCDVLEKKMDSTRLKLVELLQGIMDDAQGNKDQ